MRNCKGTGLLDFAAADRLLRAVAIGRSRRCAEDEEPLEPARYAGTAAGAGRRAGPRNRRLSPRAPGEVEVTAEAETAAETEVEAEMASEVDAAEPDADEPDQRASHADDEDGAEEKGE